MNQISILLNEVKQELKINSDYRLAQVLGVTQSAIPTMRRRGQCDNYTAFRIAEYLHKNPADIIAGIECNKNNKRSKADYFGRYLQGGTLALMLAPALFLDTAQCILCKIKQLIIYIANYRVGATT